MNPVLLPPRGGSLRVLGAGRVRRAALLAAWLGWAPGASAAAWPANYWEWGDLEEGGVAFKDSYTDGGGGRSEIVTLGTWPSAAWYADADHVFFRVRLDVDPSQSGVLDAMSYGVLVHTDADDATYEVMGWLGDSGALLALYPGTGSEGWQAEADNTALWSVADPFDSAVDLAQSATANTSANGTQDYFLDLAIARTDWESATGLAADAAFQVAIVTDSGDTLAFDGDVANGNGNTSDDLSSVLCDPLIIDEDLDGLTLFEEEEHDTDPTVADSDSDGVDDGEEVSDGTEPMDPDSDDDGVLDGDEKTAGTDPLDDDSDDDGALDGAEATAGTNPLDDDSDDDGLTDGQEATLGTNPLVADTDGDGLTDYEEAHSAGTGTNPLEADTDGDGIDDGTEIEWHFDPNRPDSDDDGLSDQAEAECDLDAPANDRDSDGIDDQDELDNAASDGDLDDDDLPDWCDDDDDNDGIPSSDEGDGDADDDGVPNHLDTDSDNDGVLDEDEGTGDRDCDDTADYLDSEDEDGSCGDLDEDGLINEAEICGFDENDPDTDGDGVLDGQDTCPDGSDQDPGADDPADCADGRCDGYLSGGACSAVPAAPGCWALLAASLIALIRRGSRRRSAPGRALALLGGATLVGRAATPGAAEAQQVNGQRFRPSMDGRDFLVTDDASISEAGVGGGLLFNLATDPLVVRYPGSEVEDAVLERVGTSDLLVSASFWRARLGLDLPLHLIAREPAGTSGKLLGDPALDGKVSLFDPAGGKPGLAVGARLSVPTDSEMTVLGEPGLAWQGRLIGAWSPHQRLRLAANLGYLGTEDVTFYESAVGSRLTWSGGLGVPLTRTISSALELSGDRFFGDRATRGAVSPLELLGSARLAASNGLIASLGAGAGVSAGVGAPDLRVALGLAWLPERAAPGPGPKLTDDPDKDGIVDSIDLCPDDPEDPNGVNDADGCPDDGFTLTRFRVVAKTQEVGRTDDKTEIQGATIHVREGARAGTFWTLATGEVTRALTPGPYTLGLEANGYLDTVQKIVVPAQERWEADLTMTPVPHPCEVQFVVRDPDNLPIAAIARAPATGDRIEIDADGVGTGQLEPGSYEFFLSAEGLATESRMVSCKPDGTANYEVTLGATPRATLKSDQIVLSQQITFELNKDTIEATPDNRAILEELFLILQQHPELAEVEIQGHTDRQGSRDLNMDLSLRRAQAVAQYLVTRGVDGTRLVARGYGPDRPLFSEDTPAAYAANRRVEIHVSKRSPE